MPGAVTAVHCYDAQTPLTSKRMNLDAGGLRRYSSFPWNYVNKPKLDGVVLNVGALPGGEFPLYSIGQTATHEVGHWCAIAAQSGAVCMLIWNFEGGQHPLRSEGQAQSQFQEVMHPRCPPLSRPLSTRCPQSDRWVTTH